MKYYNIPIIEKIYEAYSAIADGRITIQNTENNDEYKVTSSDYSKSYTIFKTNNTYVSDDNMSFWKQTIGYPILAIMMVNGELQYNEDVIKYFKNINWKKINTEYKNDYVKVASLILEEMNKNKIDIDFIKSETEKVYSQVKNLKLEYVKSKVFPPK